MTTKRIMDALRTVAALPADDFQPSDWDALSAVQTVARDEVGRWERAEARKASARAQRPTGAKRRVGGRKPDPPELVMAKKVVRARSGGRCEARTPWCEGRATQVHHIHGRNDNDPDMLLHVCGLGNASGCHGYIHQNPAIAYERGWLVSKLGMVRP